MYLGYQNGKIKFYTEQELPKEFYNLDKVEYTEDEYVLDGEEYVLKDEAWEAKQAQAEAERILNLKLTKRVFALALQEYGITYTQLKELIATNEQAQLEWDLCVELERKNPLLDVMALQLGVTSAELDYIFRRANGEDVEPPVKPEPDVDNSEPTINENLTVEDDTDSEVVDNSEE